MAGAPGADTDSGAVEQDDILAYEELPNTVCFSEIASCSSSMTGSDKLPDPFLKGNRARGWRLPIVDPQKLNRRIERRPVFTFCEVAQRGKSCWCIQVVAERLHNRWMRITAVAVLANRSAAPGTCCRRSDNAAVISPEGALMRLAYRSLPPGANDGTSRRVRAPLG